MHLYDHKQCHNTALFTIDWNFQQNERKRVCLSTKYLFILLNITFYLHEIIICQYPLTYINFTLLSRVILMWLTVSFPNIAIDVIEIIGRNIWDAFELEKIRISRNSQEWWQDYQGKHRCRRKYIACKNCNIELWDVTAASIQRHIRDSPMTGRNWNATSQSSL